jgi:acyl-coenzyme A synthetase/AMP-(fatty) acid ligase
LRAGSSATQQDLIAHVKTKIAGYKAPREVHITVDLPKTSTGKIQKYMLREAEWAGHASRVKG